MSDMTPKQKQRCKRAVKRQERLDKEPKKTIVVLYSHDAHSVFALKEEDSEWGFSYKIVAACTDNAQAIGTARLESLGIRCECYNWDTFWFEKMENDNEQYFQKIESWIDSHNPDFIILSEFTREMPQWFVRKFEGKIIATVNRDLSVTDTVAKNHTCRKRDLYITQEMIQNGLKKTCSTAYFITTRGSKKHIIAFSKPCAIAVSDTPRIVQKRLKHLCEWQALKYALAKIMKWQWPRSLFRYTHP